MQNWKTTLFATIAAAAGFVLFSPQHFPPVVIDIAKYIMVGGLAGLGISARDKDKPPTQAEVNAATAEAHEKALKNAGCKVG